MRYLTRKHLSRRTVLRAAGVSLGLPLLDAMIPAATALAQTAAAPKLRAGFFYIPHGAILWNNELKGLGLGLASMASSRAPSGGELSSTEFQRRAAAAASGGAT